MIKTSRVLTLLLLCLHLFTGDSFSDNTVYKNRPAILFFSIFSGELEDKKAAEIEHLAVKEFGKYATVIRREKCEDKTTRRFSVLPDEIKFPDILKKKLRYNRLSKTLTYQGVMSKVEEDTLLALSKNIQYQIGIEMLFEKSNRNDCLRKIAGKLKSNIAVTLKVERQMGNYSLNLTLKDIFENQTLSSNGWNCRLFDERQLTDALIKMIADNEDVISDFLNTKKENEDNKRKLADIPKIPLTINTLPENAKIYINDKMVGITPFNGEINGKAGRAEMRLKHPLYLEHKFQAILNNKNNSFETIELVPNFGTFQIDSSQEDASVTIKDWSCSVISSGITPFEKKIPKGRYMVTVSKIGYETKYIPKAVTSGLTVVIGKKDASLREMFGEVTFCATPHIDGAEIFVDGEKIGTAPTIKKIKSGIRLVEIISENMKGREIISVEDKEESMLNIELEEIPDEMVMLRGGFYEMGDFQGDGEDDERPLHKVSLPPFAIDKHEVTILSYAKVTMKNRSFFYTCPNCPVENVTWYDAQDYCAEIGKRLPTEAEWEYAAREAGKEIITSIGGKIMGAEEANFNANSRDNTKYSKGGEFRNKTLPVASFRPNSLGLYDMSGNVWEWVSDWYDPKYYKNSPVYNARGSSKGTGKVLRGGSWYNKPALLRTTNRYALDPKVKNSRIGFRCAK